MDSDNLQNVLTKVRVLEGELEFLTPLADQV